MVKERLKNPLFTSALLSAVIIYSGVFKVPVKNKLQTILPKSGITCVSGVILSSPAKTANGKYYSANMKVDFVSGGIGECDGAWSRATGNTTVCIPAEITESLFPGKLYSRSRQNEIIESGTKITLFGKFNGDRFFAKSVENHGFQKGFGTKKIRAIGRLQFKRLMYSWKDAGGLLLALLSGSREYTEEVTSEAFKNAGLSHILALSGMHLSMMSGIALFFAVKIGRKKLSYILQLLAVVLFVWFAGLSPSLLRALICSLAVLIQRISNVEESDMVCVLCFSFIVQTIISPNDLQNIGFILSYGALVGILLLSDFFKAVYSKALPQKIAESFAASTGAQASTIPICAKVFGRITPIGIVSAVIVSPLATVFIYSGLALIILCLIFPSLVHISGFFMEIQYNLIRTLVVFFSKFPAIDFL